MHGRPDPESEEAVDAGSTVSSATAAYERALAERPPVRYRLLLFIAGSAPRSMRAVSIARRLCDEYLPDCHQLEIVDIYQQPALAEAAGILAVPALVRKHPPPQVMVVGDMSDTQRLVRALGLAQWVRKDGG